MSRCRFVGIVLIVLASLNLTGCHKGGSYTAIALTDPRLAEFKDLLSVDRPAIGIPALPASADVVVERSNGKVYDVMLHIYAGPQQRTIAFRREDAKLKWIGEQVLVDGPRKHTTVDGTFNEQITLTYETSRVAHYRINRLNVAYMGPDADLSAKSELTLADVQPFLDQWLRRP